MIDCTWLWFIPQCNFHFTAAMTSLWRNYLHAYTQCIYIYIYIYIYRYKGCDERFELVFLTSIIIQSQAAMLRLMVLLWHSQGLYSLSGKMSFHQISWCLEGATLGVMIILSLWNLAAISIAVLPRCLSQRLQKFKPEPLTDTSSLRGYWPEADVCGGFVEDFLSLLLRMTSILYAINWYHHHCNRSL